MKTTRVISAYGTAAMLVLLCVIKLTNGHGRLLEPPGRSSMWRVGFNTPINYNDNALYCGGFQVRTGSKITCEQLRFFTWSLLLIYFNTLLFVFVVIVAVVLLWFLLLFCVHVSTICCCICLFVAVYCCFVVVLLLLLLWVLLLFV